MIESQIPDTLRICAGCGDDICWDGEYCVECQQIQEFERALRHSVNVLARAEAEAQYHAQRANEVFKQQPRETGGEYTNVVARSINACFTWLDCLSPRQGLALFALGLAASWLAIGWVVGRFTQ